MKKMFEEMREKKGELVEQRDQLKAELKAENNEQKRNFLDYKLRDIESQLKSDYIKVLEERGEQNEVFLPKKSAAPANQKQFKENREKTQEEIQRDIKAKKREEQKQALER